MSFGPLVTAGWLREHIGDRDVTVIDFRWHLLGPDGRDEYLSGHIPGAVFVDLEAVTGTRGGGRHPLPAAWQVQDEMQKAGLDDVTKVVVYDDAGGSVAARLWFLLGWFGHGAQAVLDNALSNTPAKDVPAASGARAPSGRRSLADGSEAPGPESERAPAGTRRRPRLGKER